VSTSAGVSAVEVTGDRAGRNGISFTRSTRCLTSSTSLAGEPRAEESVELSHCISRLFPNWCRPDRRYGALAPQIAGTRETSRAARHGRRRFIIGLGKKVLIANTFGRAGKDGDLQTAGRPS